MRASGEVVPDASETRSWCECRSVLSCSSCIMWVSVLTVSWKTSTDEASSRCEQASMSGRRLIALLGCWWIQLSTSCMT
jgi:hypothetical protein